MRITVTINGGPENVWHEWGLTCNPFPQLPAYEFVDANRRLRALDSDPLTSVEDIRRILEGCESEFIELCCRSFRPGERVQFDVTWPS